MKINARARIKSCIQNKLKFPERIRALKQRFRPQTLVTPEGFGVPIFFSKGGSDGTQNLKSALGILCEDKMRELKGMKNPLNEAEFEGKYLADCREYLGIFEYLYKKFGLDLLETGKRGNIFKAISDRMKATKHSDLNEYLSAIESSEEELQELLTLAISHKTYFFRRTANLSKLKMICRELAERNPQKKVIRIWVPGCSTGEEVYSIAMLLQGAREKSPALKELKFAIQGTDIVASFLEKAEKGEYDKSSTNFQEKSSTAVFEKFVKKGFIIERNGKLIINKEKLEGISVVFSQHSLMDRYPFIPDIICCRNTLMYFSLTKMFEVLKKFHSILPKGGYLLLTEPTTILEDIFQEKTGFVYMRNKVHQKPITGNSRK